MSRDGIEKKNPLKKFKTKKKAIKRTITII
jgi:hypothetical protein